jgi:hypothetical protein
VNAHLAVRTFVPAWRHELGCMCNDATATGTFSLLVFIRHPHLLRSKV